MDQAKATFDWARWYSSIPGIPFDWGNGQRMPSGIGTEGFVGLAKPVGEDGEAVNEPVLIAA